MLVSGFPGRGYPSAATPMLVALCTCVKTFHILYPQLDLLSLPYIHPPLLQANHTIPGILFFPNRHNDVCLDLLLSIRAYILQGLLQQTIVSNIVYYDKESS